MTQVRLHDFPGLKIWILISTTFQDMYTPCDVCVKHIQAEVIISIFTLFSASESETKSRALSVMLHCHAITEIHNNGKILLS